jgi:hypothetical protein
MDPHEFLTHVSIPTPCPMDWADMKGDDRIRFCASCSKHVYDISAMPAVEAAELIRSHEGELCAQFYRRPDGTIVTAECTLARSRSHIIKAIGGAALALATLLGITVPTWAIWLFSNPMEGAADKTNIAPATHPKPVIERFGGKVCIRPL